MIRDNLEQIIKKDDSRRKRGGAITPTPNNAVVISGDAIRVGETFITVGAP